GWGLGGGRDGWRRGRRDPEGRLKCTPVRLREAIKSHHVGRCPAVDRGVEYLVPVVDLDPLETLHPAHHFPHQRLGGELPEKLVAHRREAHPPGRGGRTGGRAIQAERAV